jgi:hypothetical protein
LPEAVTDAALSQVLAGRWQRVARSKLAAQVCDSVIHDPDLVLDHLDLSFR